MTHTEAPKNGNGMNGYTFIRYLNTLLIGIVGFVLIQMYMKVDNALTRIEINNNTIGLHDLRITRTESDLNKLIGKMEWELEQLKKKIK